MANKIKVLDISILEYKTLGELKNFAKNRNIPEYDRLSKEELIAKLDEFQKQHHLVGTNDIKKQENKATSAPALPLEPATDNSKADNEKATATQQNNSINPLKKDKRKR